MTLESHEVAIVGAGPAGISAAIYLKRAGIDPLILERGKVGGLLVNANLVENYPGFPDGISGRDLVSLFNKHIRHWRISVTPQEVTRISRAGSWYTLVTEEDCYLARFLIVATGTRAKHIQLEGLDSLPRGRVHHEIAGIRGDLRDKVLLIVGGGDAAFDYALNASSRGGSARIIFRSAKPTCLKLLLQRAKRDKRIVISPGTSIHSVRKRGREILAVCDCGSRRRDLTGDYLLVACGRGPNIRFLSPSLREQLARPGGDSPVSGLYFIGDVRRGFSRQVGIAVGDGIAAAMDITRRIGKEGSREGAR